MTSLKDLADERLIEEVYDRYCGIIDGKQFARLTEVFTEDCVGDYRNTNGIVDQGVRSLIERLERGMGPGSDCGRTHHNVLNFRIFIAGDTAKAKAHFYAVHEGVNRCAGESYTCWGEYDDEWVRTEAGWRVRSRTYRNFLIDGTVDVVRRTRGN